MGLEGSSQAPSELTRPTTSFANARQNNPLHLVSARDLFLLPGIIDIPKVGSYEEAQEVESKGWAADAYYREPERHHEAISTNKLNWVYSCYYVVRLMLLYMILYMLSLHIRRPIPITENLCQYKLHPLKQLVDFLRSPNSNPQTP